MSQTFSIGCQQCRKHLWIAQAGLGGYTLYTDQPETMSALKDFLFEHIGHPLVFKENCESEMADWEEIETESKPTDPCIP